VRTKIKKEFDNVFKTVDAIICPTTPTTAFPIGENINDPVTMYLQDIYTVPANIAGLPAISVPVGLKKGLPVGLQVIGKAFNDSEVLGIAGAVETNAKFERIYYEK
jgi:aspartyl-tRNA(Asn)/glutamyl-tRNA(Gln) amidotransferase subunit A